jgi:stage III sporulation protein AD
MIDVVKIALVGILSCFLILAIKQEKPEFALCISLCAGVIIFGFCANYVLNVIDYINAVCAYAGVDFIYLEIVLKIIGISYVCEFAGGVCRDSENTGIASKIDLGGKISIIVLSLPIVKNILDLMLGLLG